MRHIVFEGSAFQDFVEWATVDHKMFQRIVHLIMDTLRGFDHGVGHPLLLLGDAKAPNCRKNKAFKDLGHYSEWPKVADAVIEACTSMPTYSMAGLLLAALTAFIPCGALCYHVRLTSRFISSIPQGHLR